MEQNHDIVIIGAGPAGTACALKLLKNGYNPLLIDKAVFPRNKTCAGLVTAKTYELIKELLPDSKLDGLFCDEASEIAFYNGQDEVVRSPFGKPVHLVKRVSFDNALVGEYKAAGGNIREGKKAVSFDFERREITLTGGETVKYKSLIFSDGALSLAHRRAHYDKRKLAFGIETYIPRELIGTKSIDIYFGYLENGYVWVFPHGDTVCIGAVDSYKNNKNSKSTLTAFLDELNIETENLNFVGAFLPYGKIVPQKKLPENVFLIGDAGGFTDPISGEGLYMALKTGITAANALKTSEPKKTFLRNTKQLKRVVREGKKLQTIIYSPFINKKLMRKVNGKTRLVSWFFEKQVHHYSYRYKHMLRLRRDFKKSKGE